MLAFDYLLTYYIILLYLQTCLKKTKKKCIRPLPIIFIFL